MEYADICLAQERAWQPVVDALGQRGISAEVVQTGGMVFCIVVSLPNGNEVAWGVSSADVWEGADAQGERVFGSDVAITPAPFAPVEGIQAERLAAYIADSVEEMSTGSYL